MLTNPEDSARCILACFTLQNICINHGDVADFDGAENQQPDGYNSINENAHSQLGTLKEKKLKIT